jgi:group I intron endonuclease
MEKISGIYCIENTVNHKKYIGQSVNIYTRWKQHKNDLYNNKHRNNYLQKAWNKYGENNFNFQIIEKCDEDNLNEKEMYYINMFKTINRDYGYNLDSGGSINRYMSDESKFKMSLAKSYVFGEKNSFYGKHHSDDTKRYLRELWNNNEWSDGVRSKMIENHADVSGANNPMYGRKHTAQSKENMSKNTQKLFSSDNPNARNVYCVELNRYFGSIVEAAKCVGISRNTLSLHLNGKSKSAGKNPMNGEKLHRYYTDLLTRQND